MVPIGSSSLKQPLVASSQRASHGSVPAQPAKKPATTDQASISPEGAAAAARDMVLGTIKDLFGITTVASMDLSVDLSHQHGEAAAISQRSGPSGSDFAASYRAIDHTALNASGTITLEDGRSFNLDLNVERTVMMASNLSYHQDGPGAPLADGGPQVSWQGRPVGPPPPPPPPSDDQGPDTAVANATKRMKKLLALLMDQQPDKTSTFSAAG